MEGGPWWLCWTEGKVVELRSRLASGPQERHSCCLCGGPVRLYAIVYMTVTVWNEAADGLHQREPQLWNKCVVSPPYGSHGSKEQYNWPERTDARVGSPRGRELYGSYVPGSHPGPDCSAVAVVSPTGLYIAVPLAESLRCKPWGSVVLCGHRYP